MVAVNPLPQSLATMYSHFAACAAPMCAPNKATDVPSTSFLNNMRDFADRNFINQSSRNIKNKLQIIDKRLSTRREWSPKNFRTTENRMQQGEHMVDKTRSETLLTYFYGAQPNALRQFLKLNLQKDVTGLTGLIDKVR